MNILLSEPVNKPENTTNDYNPKDKGNPKRRENPPP